MSRFFFAFAATLVALPAQTLPSIAVSPAVGAGTEATITVTINKTGELERLSVVRFLMHQQLDGAGACFIQHNVGSSSLSLRDDANSAWLPPVTLGGVTNVSNQQCTVVASASSAGASASVYTIVLRLRFEPAFGGRRLIWIQAMDDAGMASGVWQYRADWMVPTSTSGSSSQCIRADGSIGPCLAAFRTDRFRVAAPVPASFTLSQDPMPGTEPRIYRNGLLLMPADDYTLNGRQLKFLCVIVPSDIIQAEYWVQ